MDSTVGASGSANMVRDASQSRSRTGGGSTISLSNRNAMRSLIGAPILTVERTGDTFRVSSPGLFLGGNAQFGGGILDQSMTSTSMTSQSSGNNLGSSGTASRSIVTGNTGTNRQFSSSNKILDGTVSSDLLITSPNMAQGGLSGLGSDFRSQSEGPVYTQTLRQNGQDIQYDKLMTELYSTSQMQDFTARTHGVNETTIAMDEACESICLRGRNACLRQHNCTFYQQCYPVAGKCMCPVRRCPWGTLFSEDHEMCIAASAVNCRRECPLVKDKNNPSFYYFKNYELHYPMKCAPGTVFDDVDCTCIYSDTVTGAYKQTTRTLTRRILHGCGPILYIDFSNGTIDNRVIGVPIYYEGVRAFSTNSGGEHGNFNGGSFIRVPVFKGQSPKYWAVRVRFLTPGDSGPNTQVLLGDCHFASTIGTDTQGLDHQSPSFAMLINRKKGVLYIWASAYDAGFQSVVMEVPIKFERWNDVQLLFNGETIEARVKDLSTEKETRDLQPLKGRLGTILEPLRIGGCSRFDSFHGYIDLHRIDNSENQKPKAYKIRIKQKPKHNKQKPPPYEKKRTPDMRVRPGAQEE
ncbi:hypothetical protein FSP39_006475 [Pinctada imbricata]|uniref:Uncharacterized protein n=1 Tax=Pinctada imbricata TaxID=66713 RepID=A0AA88YUS6_PINIB|nr:hypothetical protein FSP39_006475 [Pinctada imbricata]